MHAIPWFSTFTLFTELLVTVSVLYIFYSGYNKNIFPYKLTAVTLTYEILFNISYMASRLYGGKNPSRLESGLVITLAIFHGTFSLIMFIALVAFMILAWVNYKNGVNYFFAHKKLTVSFIVLWLLAVVSGFGFYYVSYLR